MRNRRMIHMQSLKQKVKFNLCIILYNNVSFTNNTTSYVLKYRYILCICFGVCTSVSVFESPYELIDLKHSQLCK